MRILKIGTIDEGGGAEKICRELFLHYLEQGHEVRMAVGQKSGSHPGVFALSDQGLGIYDPLVQDADLPEAERLLRREEHAAGIEDFRFPASRKLPDSVLANPDVIHAHNLHGGYFDLNMLAPLSRRHPTVLTLHDAWLLAGNCAHSFDCERWRTGCGQCPNIAIYPGLKQDATAENWRRKRAIYQRSRLFVATPCRWLMDKVEQSILAEGLAGGRVIPYGLDLTVFRPGDKARARRELGLPQDAKILLFAATCIKTSWWRDFRLLKDALTLAGELLDGRDILFLGLGDDSPPERVGKAQLQFIPFQKDQAAVLKHFQAADLYVHPAKQDTFPNVVLEALACGTPVAATAVCGIVEQVRGLCGDDGRFPRDRHNAHGPDQATGRLSPAGDAQALGQDIAGLLADEALLERLGRNAASDAARRFEIGRQVRDYLSWYEELLAEHRPG